MHIFCGFFLTTSAFHALPTKLELCYDSKLIVVRGSDQMCCEFQILFECLSVSEEDCLTRILKTIDMDKNERK